MKTTNSQTSKDIFTDYAISNEEMIYIRGGEGDVIIKTTIPPIVI
jgi:hypothetical protein